jgi:SPP1 family predicted phage head-tail adaptor
MIIGEMDRCITLQKRTITKDTNGERLESWLDDIDVWAQVIERHGREAFQTGQTVAVRDDRFRIYFIDELNAADYRVSYNGKLYDIESVITIGHDEFQDLICRFKDNMP